MIHECRNPLSHSRGDSSGRSACCSHQIYGSSNCMGRVQTCTNKTEERMIVCYFTNWAWYRSGIAKFTPENINASLCTHINYAFAKLDSDSLTIKSSDTWADIDNKFYQRVVDFVAKGLKVLLCIGGWNNSGPEVGWSRMCKNATARGIFVKSVVEFLERYNFSGLDVDYEYPGCPQGNRSAGSPSDAENFNQLMSELKDAFNGKYLLSMAVSAGKDTLINCYNISQLCQIPDWINIMSYDYHSWSEGVVGANAPIHGTGSWGVYETVRYLTSVAKCPAKKLVLGVPFYGQTYTLADTSSHKFGDKVYGPGNAGAYTQSPGSMAYYEICMNQKSGWKTGWNWYNDSYAWNGTQFVSFDSGIDLKSKSCLIKYFGLKGAMFWTLDYDDFSNSCGYGVYPLLKTLNKQLRCLNVSNIEWC